MGVITISLDNESEKLLRDSAKIHYGNRKDAISKTIIKALNNLENSRDDLKKNLINKLKNNNKKLNKNQIKNRDNYYK
ncbi:MAG: hypothetical protein PHX47_03145 [Candidatus ainarchaeum sp.]|nr:hypothetical protein [Candidatus ainarchaeum sp.]